MEQEFGSEVQPAPPVQDMEQIDTIASGPNPDAERDAQPGDYTGGTGGGGMGGQAEGEAPPKQKVP